MRLVGILLAAGRSERFGGDKLVAPLPRPIDDIPAGTPIGVAACRHLAAALPEVLAVVRPGDATLAALLRDAGARVVECARAAEGMGESLACGVRSTPDADGWLIALADMPSIKPATITMLASALQRGADIVAPQYNGQRGHPVGFVPRSHFRRPTIPAFSTISTRRASSSRPASATDRADAARPRTTFRARATSRENRFRRAAW